MQERTDFNLMRQIQERSRLVEQQDLRRLRQCPGNHAPLPFPSREIRHDAIAQVGNIRGVHRLHRNAEVLLILPPEPDRPAQSLMMRIPAHEDGFTDGEGKHLKDLLVPAMTKRG
jgi:hypothetical protein